MVFEKRIQIFIGLSCALFATGIIGLGIAFGYVIDTLSEVIPIFRFDTGYRKSRINAPRPNELGNQLYGCFSL